jgi:ribosomal protein S18 acetylase RimI-like enzyme
MIRIATPEDAAAITHVQVVTWKSAYKGIVNDDFLNNFNVNETRIQRWAEWLNDSTKFGYVIDLPNVGVVGFVVGGACRDDIPSFDGELYAIYLLPDYQRFGYGRVLLRTMAQCLFAEGYRAMLLWVLKDNLPARAFYERVGGQFVQEKDFSIDNQPLKEVGYGWHDLSKFMV